MINAKAKLIIVRELTERQGQHRRRHNQEQGQVHQQQQQQQQGAQRSPLPSSSSTLTSGEALTLRVVNPLDNLTTHQQRGIREGNVSERNQFANRVLCRTPPPVYDSLPATPPPSYTPHRGVDVGVAGGATADGGVILNAVAHNPEIWQQCQPFSAQLDPNAADYREVVLPANSIGYHQQQQRQQLVQHSENVAATVEQQEQQQERLLEAHLQLGEQQQQQQQQQQLRRRRRLHLLQQQRLSNINAASTDSTSSSNCSFDYRHNNNYHFNSSNQLGGSSSDSEAYARLPVGSERRQQCRQQRIGRGLRDAYCPDLLHACSLILHQHLEQPIEANDTSDSSVSNFTPTPPPRTQSRCSTDYVEIEEIRPVTRDREAELFRELQPGSWQIQVARAISTPELVCRNDVGAALNVACVESPDVEYQRLIKNSTQRDMGQNLSLRRPRISLTWVLREQQQQSQQQQPNEVQTPTNDGDDEPGTTKKLGNGTAETPNNNNGCVIGTAEPKQRTEVVPTQLTTTSTTNTATTTTTTTTTKRYRLKQLPGSNDPLNGYATTPTAYMPANALAPQKFFSNQNLLEYRDKSRAPSRELLFVCTPQRLPKSYDTSDALSLAKKRNEIRKRLASKMATLQANGRAKADGAEANQLAKNGCASVAASGVANTNCVVLEKDELKSLKGTYSEPSLIAASDGHQRRHRHRKRRERNRGPKFGYEISNVDEFLSKCSLASPGNIPVVLSAPSTLYQTRPGQHQIEIPLPLGMVVNAVFKNQNWLYVQTSHAEEGYVGYSCCLPLGILPPSARSASTGNNKPAPCWESNGDIFPRPGGNMTDSEKEIRLRGGTRSDGARTPRGKRGDAVGTDGDTKNGNTSIVSAAASTCGEHQVDSLYLRAASQPRLVEKAYAQLKSTKQALALRNSGNDEYVTLQQQQQQQQHKSKLHVQKHMQQQQQQLQQLHQKHLITGPYITNGHNGQHLHPKNANISTVGSVSHAASVASVSHTASFAAKSPINGSVHDTNQQKNAGVLHMASRKQHGLRQTLVAINTDYSTDSIVLHKGEIVTLCECRESKDHQQWFYVRTRDGREGYIPAEVAGHGYL